MRREVAVVCHFSKLFVWRALRQQQPHMTEPMSLDDEKPQKFKLAKERGLPSQAKLIEWCSTMDLIAVTTVENSIGVYRWVDWVRIILDFYFCF